MNFLPDNYEVPKSKGNYYKFEKGQNKFRIVSSAIIGYVYWTEENKPVRLKEYPDTFPLDMKIDKGSTPDKAIKHFWALTIIDRKTGKIQVLEITQKSIMGAIKDIVDNEDWGNPQGYDITVTRTGEGIETEYTVQPSPHKELTAEEKQLVKDTPVNLEALFSAGDPFENTPAQQLDEAVKNPQTETYDAHGNPDDVRIEDIKF